MPISRKKLAAKQCLSHQFRNTNSGQFEQKHSGSEENSDYSNNYSTSSSDEEYCSQKILKLGDISLVLTNSG